MPHIGSYGNIWEWDVVEIKGIRWQNWRVSANGLGIVKMFNQFLEWGMILRPNASEYTIHLNS